MAINIKNREAEALLASLARRTRLGKTRLVLELLRQESARQARLGDVEARKRKIKAVARRFARKAAASTLTDEQILGYDQNGLPR